MAKHLFQKGEVQPGAGRPKGSKHYKTLMQEAFIKILETENKIKNPGKTAMTQSYYQNFLETAMAQALRNPNSKAGMFLLERLIEPGVLDAIDSTLNKSRREDTDFQLYRILKQGFAIQQQILMDLNKKIIIMAGRRAGKTDVIKKKIGSVLLTKEDAKVLYVAKTISVGMQQVFEGVMDLLNDFNNPVIESNRTEGRIKLSNNSELFIRGNSSTEEREKLRGFRWDLAIIDEAQSQTALPYLINDVIEPALIDRKGQLFIAGTGPRVRGTYFETLWTEVDTFKASRYNWNLSDNIFIEDYEKVLDSILEEKHLTKDSPLFIREYLGKLAFDIDALVVRLEPPNFYEDKEMIQWIQSQPRSDIKFTAGLDFGFVDSNAFVIVMYSEKKNERWIVYEYKEAGTSSEALAKAVKKGIEYINTDSKFYEIPTKFFYIYADSANQQLIYDFFTQYKLPVQNAYKANKDFAYELLQEETRKGFIKTKRGSIFEDEAMKTVYARNDADNLTRVVDDDLFHPDLMDALLYSLRSVWMYGIKEEKTKEQLFLDRRTGQFYEA